MSVQPGDEVKVQRSDEVYVVRSVTRPGGGMPDYALVQPKGKDDTRGLREVLLHFLRPACDACAIVLTGSEPDVMPKHTCRPKPGTGGDNLSDPPTGEWIAHPLPEGTRVVAANGHVYDLGRASRDPTIGFVYVTTDETGAGAKLYARDIIRIVRPPEVAPAQPVRDPALVARGKCGAPLMWKAGGVAGLLFTRCTRCGIAYTYDNREPHAPGEPGPMPYCDAPDHGAAAVLDVVDSATLDAVRALRLAQEEKRSAEAAMEAARKRLIEANATLARCTEEAAKALDISTGD